MPHFSGVFAGTLVEGIGDKDRNVAARTGNRPDESADDAAGEDIRPDLADGLAIGQNAGDLLR